MWPTLFEIGGITFPSYYTLLTVAFITALWIAAQEADRKGLERNRILDLGLLMVVSGIIGSRILHVFADGYLMDYIHLCTDPLKVEVPQFIHVMCQTDADCIAKEAGALCHPETGRCHPGRDCLASLKFWYGGLAFLGGFVGALGVGTWFVRKYQLPFWKTADLAAPCLAIGQAIGRMGCYLGGCCYGAQTDGSLGVQFSGYLTHLKANATCPPNYQLIETPTENLCGFGSPAFIDQAKNGLLETGVHESLAVYPTQVMESALVFGIFVWLYFYRRTRQRFTGQAFCEYILFYGIGRFCLEFFRADERGSWLGDALSTSQLIAIPLVIWAIWKLRKGDDHPAEGAA